MRVISDIEPNKIHIEDYVKQAGYVEVRIRDNIKEVQVIDYDNEIESFKYEYDEYIFIVENQDNLEKSIEDNFSDWILTGMSNENILQSGFVDDMKKSLSIMGVNL